MYREPPIMQMPENGNTVRYRGKLYRLEMGTIAKSYTSGNELRNIHIYINLKPIETDRNIEEEHWDK